MMNLLFEYLIFTKVFIGYKRNHALDLILKSVLDLIVKVYELPQLEIKLLEEKVFSLFTIQTYTEYVLLSNTNELNKYENANIYFEYLKDSKNESKVFSNKEFKYILNEMAIEGNIDAIRLKAILLYLGVVYNQSTSSSTQLLKMLAYMGDTISFKLLSYIDSDYKEKYIQIYDSINELMDGYVISIDQLPYSKEIKDECNFIMENKKELTNNENKNMLRYYLITDVQAIKKVMDYINPNKKISLGF